MKEKNLKPSFSRELTLEELAALPDDAIDLTDIPEQSKEWFKKARIAYPQERKQQLTMRLDPDIVAFFKAQGKGYQTRINSVLRTYVDAMKE